MARGALTKCTRGSALPAGKPTRHGLRSVLPRLRPNAKRNCGPTGLKTFLLRWKSTDSPNQQRVGWGTRYFFAENVFDHASFPCSSRQCGAQRKYGVLPFSWKGDVGD
jgi:hypothetical protein